MLQEWKSRFNGFLHINETEQQKLRVAGKDKRLSRLSQKRIKRLLEAKDHHKNAVIRLLAPLGFDFKNFEDASSASKLLRSKLPKTQGLFSYYANVFRDWAWENGENEASLEALEAVMLPGLKDTQGLGKTLTLGAGACRLSYDLHRKYAPELSVLLDFNPFLLLLAKRVIEGETIELYEFPVAPLDQHSFAVPRSCKAPQPLNEGLHFLLSDAINPPLVDKSFDTILTPWLIDIIPQNLREYIPRINRLLKTGATWLNFGSIAFFHKDEASCYSQEEVLELVEKSGFELLSVERRTLPYLQSPASAHGRVERVLCFSARKRRDVIVPPLYEYLPKWIRDTKKPIPDLNELTIACSTHLLQAQMLGAIDGKRSIDEIASMVAAKYALALPEATAAVKRILTETYETHLAEKPNSQGMLG